MIGRPCSAGPRFGSVNISVFATNLIFLSQHPTFMAPRCSLGQQGTAEVAPAVVVLPGELSADGSSLVCPTPTTFFPEGRHVVRVSFNDQQYTAPMPSMPLPTVSFHAIGPLLKMSNKVYHVGESHGLLDVDVELVGESVLNVSVMINVSHGGSSVLPGWGGGTLESSV